MNGKAKITATVKTPSGDVVMTFHPDRLPTMEGGTDIMRAALRAEALGLSYYDYGKGSACGIMTDHPGSVRDFASTLSNARGWPVVVNGPPHPGGLPYGGEGEGCA